MTNEAHIAAVHDDIRDRRNAREVIWTDADIKSGRPIRPDIHVAIVEEITIDFADCPFKAPGWLVVVSDTVLIEIDPVFHYRVPCETYIEQAQ